MKKFLFFLVIVIASFASCNKQENPADGGNCVFYATIEPFDATTRVSAEQREEGGNTYVDIEWDKDDFIYVIEGSKQVLNADGKDTYKFICEDPQGNKRVQFNPEDPTVKMGNTCTSFYGVDNTGRIANVIEGVTSGSVKHLPMYSICNSDNRFAFKNIFGVFKLNLSNATNLTQVRVTISDNSKGNDPDYKMTGRLTVSNNVGSIFYNYTTAQVLSKEQLDQLYGEVSTDIVLNITGSESEKVIYVPIAPSTKQWIIEFTDNGNKKTKQTKSSQTVNANEMYTMDFDLNTL